MKEILFPIPIPSEQVAMAQRCGLTRIATARALTCRQDLLDVIHTPCREEGADELYFYCRYLLLVGGDQG